MERKSYRVRINPSQRIPAFEFWQNGQPYPVFILEKKNACNFIPITPPTSFSWQRNLLEIEKENNQVTKAWLDKTLIFDVNCPKRSPLENFIANYPVNSHLEEDIAALPILYQFGLRCMLYQREYTLFSRQHLSACVWLNQIAARVYQRYNPDTWGITMPV